MEFFELQNRETQKSEKFSGQKTANKDQQTHPSKRSSRPGRGATRSKTPATQPHDKPTATNGKRQAQEQQPQAAQAQENAATHKKKTNKPPTPPGRTNPARNARHTAHARPPPTPAAPLPRSSTRKVFRSSVVEFIMLTALCRRANASVDRVLSVDEKRLCRASVTLRFRNIRAGCSINRSRHLVFDAALSVEPVVSHYCRPPSLQSGDSCVGISLLESPEGKHTRNCGGSQDALSTRSN